MILTCHQACCAAVGGSRIISAVLNDPGTVFNFTTTREKDVIKDLPGALLFQAARTTFQEVTSVAGKLSHLSSEKSRLLLIPCFGFWDEKENNLSALERKRHNNHCAPAFSPDCSVTQLSSRPPAQVSVLG